MFRKSEIKIIISIIATMMIVLAGTLSVIYFAGYKDTYDSNQKMLEIYINAYMENGNPNEKDTESNDKRDSESNAWNDTENNAEQSSESNAENSTEGNVEKKPESEAGEKAPLRPDEQAYRLSSFYSVAFSDGEAFSIDDSDGQVYSEQQLVNLAEEIMEKEKTSGVYRNMVYKVERGSEFDLVVMMDNTLVGRSMMSIFKYTLIFGSIACVIVFLISLLLARRIVRPLKENDLRQKQFISDAGHELKTPVSAINTNIEILSEDIGENRWFENIRFETGRMTDMIRRLLDLSRAESPDANPNDEMKQISLSNIVTKEILSFEAVAFEKGFELSYEAVEKEIFLKGNEEQLSRLVSILLDNAAEHGENSRPIEISLSAERSKATLTVSNAGAEIPKDKRSMIFERFYRMDTSRAGDGGHYGLGLAIAKAIVESHKGKITVDCCNENIIFTVTLPIKRI